MEKQKQVIMFKGKADRDDDVVISSLEEIGYTVITAGFDVDPDQACVDICAENVDVLIINEAASEGAEGYDFLKTAVQKTDCAIIYVSKNCDVIKEVLTLEIGADDYIKYPIHTGLLLARIRNVLKRKNSVKIKKEEEIRYPGLVVNLSQYKAEIDGEIVKMPPKELELLYLLASNPNIVYTREKLLDVIWGYDFDVGSRTVDVHIKRLRDKIEKDSNVWQIATVWSVGYRFEFKEGYSETIK